MSFQYNSVLESGVEAQAINLNSRGAVISLTPTPHFGKKIIKT